MNVRWALTAPLLMCGPVLAAGGSYLVDDAVTVDAGRCQIESWVTAVRGDAGHAVLVPACAAFGIEWSVAFGLAEGGRTLDATGVGIKRAWALDERWSIGIALGGAWAGSRIDGIGVHVPATVDVRGDGAVLFHVNAGVGRARDDRWRSSAGIGADLAFAGPVRALFEVLHVDGAETVLQGGLRWPHHDALSFDLVAGRERLHGTRSSWLTLGVNLAF